MTPWSGGTIFLLIFMLTEFNGNPIFIYSVISDYAEPFLIKEHIHCISKKQRHLLSYYLAPHVSLISKNNGNILLSKPEKYNLFNR